MFLEHMGSVFFSTTTEPATCGSHEAMELPPNNPEGDASLPIPASFEFQNGQLEEMKNSRCFCWRWG